MSIARNVGELAGGFWGARNAAVATAAPSVTKDGLQTLAIGVAIVLPLALWLRSWSARQQQATPTHGDDAPSLPRGLYRSRY